MGCNVVQNLSIGPALTTLGYTLGTDADPVMSYFVESAFVNATVRSWVTLCIQTIKQLNLTLLLICAVFNMSASC